MEEYWKDIKGYEGLYQVSNLGRCRSLDRKMLVMGFQKKPVEGIKKGRILSDKRTNKEGYIRHVLIKDGVCKQVCVHKLVAEAFLPNPYNKIRVDHIDTNPRNNRVDNLRWATDVENRNNVLTASKIRKHCYKQSTAVTEAFKRGLKKGTFYSRLRRGWTIEQSIFLPVGTRLY